MALLGDTPVTLVIKAPNQRLADQTVECMTGWTILKLKQHLELVYPTKPKHNEQRLIYSGRLLQDSQTLKEILRQYDDSMSTRYTIHLVCSSVMDSNSAASSSSTVNANSTQTPVSKPAVSASSSTCSTETNTSQTDGIRYRGNHQFPQSSSSQDLANAQLAYAAYQPGVVQDVTSYTPEQYQWMMQQQQIYSQYMMQYMMYYQSMFNPGLSVAPMMSPSFSQHIVGNIHPQQQVPHAPDAAGAAAVNNGAQEGARPNVRMNAQGGMEEEEDDEGEPRDWLHHMYFFMRVLTFLGILFFYSNLTRFLIVFTGSFAIYALQKLRKYWQKLQQEERQQQQQQQQQQQAPQPEQTEQPQHQQDPPVDVRNEEVPETVPPPGPQTGTDQQPAVEEDGSRLTRIITFVGTTVQAFFTSLLPTPPELLEPN